MAGLRPPHGSAVVDLHLRGPQRVALTGPNGVGKTSVLRCIAGETAPLEGSAEVFVPFRHLPQNLRLLEDSTSVLENVRRFAPTTTPSTSRPVRSPAESGGGPPWPACCWPNQLPSC